MENKLNNITRINNCEGAAYLTFEPLERLEWLNHGFSTRKGGISQGGLESLNLGFERGDKRKNVMQNFERFAKAAGFDLNKVSMPNQWHTNNLRIAGRDTWADNLFYDKNGTPIDGQVTNEPGTVLITYGADCVPVYIADTKNHAVGLCHSGWKGTLNSIVCDTINLMTKEYNTEPNDIIALIGPSISMDAYQVGADVAEGFISKYNINVTDTSEIVKNDSEAGKYRLDLWAANRENLIYAGVKQENIFISGICTYTEKELMYSHRRDGQNRGVMAAFMTIRE